MSENRTQGDLPDILYMWDSTKCSLTMQSVFSPHLHPRDDVYYATMARTVNRLTGRTFAVAVREFYASRNHTRRAIEEFSVYPGWETIQAIVVQIQEDNYADVIGVIQTALMQSTHRPRLYIEKLSRVGHYGDELAMTDFLVRSIDIPVSEWRDRLPRYNIPRYNNRNFHVEIHYPDVGWMTYTP